MRYSWKDTWNEILFVLTAYSDRKKKVGDTSQFKDHVSHQELRNFLPTFHLEYLQHERWLQ